MLQKWPELSDEVTIKNHAARSILDGHGITRLIKAFNKLSIDGEEFSEDLSFCHRWNQCGGDIWANITYPISHVGLYEYRGAYYDQIKDHMRPSQPPVQPAVLITPETAVSAEMVGTMVPPAHTNGAGVPA
jgi:hypothetical protein